MIGCGLCYRCMELLTHWNIKYATKWDKPEQNRPYPYITIELEYEELVDLIAKGVLK